MEEILYGLVCLILAFFMFKIHINWRKNKKIEYEKLCVTNGDYFPDNWM